MMLAITIFGWELALVIVGPVFGCCFAWRRGWRKTAGVIAIFGGLLWAAVIAPSYPKARPAAQRNACIANLQQIAEAKRSWATLTKPETTTAAQPSDLAPYLKQGQIPACPAGGTYTLGAVNAPPRCSHADKGHTLNQLPKE